jgi:hypothetical protein
LRTPVYALTQQQQTLMAHQVRGRLEMESLLSQIGIRCLLITNGFWTILFMDFDNKNLDLSMFQKMYDLHI